MKSIRSRNHDGRRSIRLQQLFRAVQPQTNRLFREVLRFTAVTYILMIFAAAVAPAATVCHSLQRLDVFHLCTPFAEASRVGDCDLNLHTIRKVMDRFIMAHLVGWSIKAAIIPNRLLLWVASVSFEVMERAAVPLLPSLRECWWDSVLIDIFLCNAAGIEMGMLLASITNGSILRNTTKLNARLSLPKAAIIVVAILITDLNAFFLKDTMHIRNASPLNVYRLVFFITLAPQCVDELTTSKNLRMKTFTCMYTIALVVEIVLVFCKWPA